MKVSVNSLPRSGSQFTVFNLNRIIGHRAVLKVPPVLGDIRKDRDYFQIVIVRNPRDNVFSRIAHTEYNDPGGYTKDNDFENQQNIKVAMDYNLKDYCDALDSFTENAEYINIYDFDHIEWAVFDIANKLYLTIPDGFVLKSMPDDADPTFWSVSGTDFYKKLLDYELEDSLFDEANKKYQAILNICQKPS